AARPQSQAPRSNTPRPAGAGAGKRTSNGPRTGAPRNNAPRDRQAREEPAVRPPERQSQQPKIVHKESKIDRFPSAELLDELPNRPRGEKPALLTRNRDS
ncbi:DEAD/DEAH box helicase, partial [Pseudomonas syringae]|nr:DEAD/DEAH box helicase [Pseudomonas syringae]